MIGCGLLPTVSKLSPTANAQTSNSQRKALTIEALNLNPATFKAPILKP